MSNETWTGTGEKPRVIKMQDDKDSTSEINTEGMRAAVQDENYKNVWMRGSTHYEGCEYVHYPCAVLKLCDEVDALRAELDKRKPIPVSERMPEAATTVMVFDKFQEEWTIGWLYNPTADNRQWTTVDGDFWRGKQFSRVTHWMPTPPAPEAK